MKKLSLLLLVFLTLLAGCATNSTSPKPKRAIDNLKYPKLNKIEIPEVEVRTLSNGMKVYMLQDDKLPVVDISIAAESGSILDPEDKIGLASLASNMISVSSKKYPAEDLKVICEENAISVYGYGSFYESNQSISFLKEDKELALDIFSDLLLNPTFDKNEFEILKNREISSIYSRNDEASAIAFREFQKALFGEDYIPIRQKEIFTINNISVDDLRKFYNDYYYSNNMTIEVYGDFDMDDMMKSLEYRFASFVSDKPKQDNKIEYNPVAKEKGVYVVDKKDATQSWVLIGHPSESRRDDDDYPALVLLNEILGGSFNSRIFQSVRTAKGLSYSPSGFLSTGWDRPGALYLLAPTATEKTILAADALVEELVKISKEKVTQEELDFAKEVYLNSWVFQFASRRSFLSKKLVYERYNIDDNYPNELKRKIEKVTVNDIYRVAKKYLKPDELIYVFVCNQDELPESLDKYGPVTELDITIKESLETQELDYKKGKEIFLGLMDDIKGKKLISNFVSKENDVANSMFGEIQAQVTSSVVFPAKVHLLTSSQQGTITIVINKDKGYQEFMGQVGPIPSEMIAPVLEQMKTSYFGILNNLDNVEVGYVEQTEIDGKLLHVLKVEFGSASEKWYVDSESNNVYFTESKQATQNGMVNVRNYFEDFKRFDNVLCPSKITSKLDDGTVLKTVQYESIKFNTEIDDSIFTIK